jgi:hypothetical protein
VNNMEQCSIIIAVPEPCKPQPTASTNSKTGGEGERISHCAFCRYEDRQSLDIHVGRTGMHRIFGNIIIVHNDSK